MKKLLGLLLFLLVFTACYIKDKTNLFPIELEELNNIISDEKWTAEEMQGYDENKSNFKIKTDWEVSLFVETISQQEERFLSLVFSTKSNQIEVEGNAQLIEKSCVLAQNLYGIKKDINKLFLNAYKTAIGFTQDTYSYSKRIADDVIIFNFAKIDDRCSLIKLSIMNIEAYEKYILGLSKVLIGNTNDIKYGTVSDIANDIIDEQTIFEISGKLENIKLVDKDETLYQNSATITDDSGTKNVLFANNGYNRKELMQDRTHYIKYDKESREYIVIYSVKNQ